MRHPLFKKVVVVWGDEPRAVEDAARNAVRAARESGGSATACGMSADAVEVVDHIGDEHFVDGLRDVFGEDQSSDDCQRD